MGNLKERIKGVSLVGFFFVFQIVATFVIAIVLTITGKISPDVASNLNVESNIDLMVDATMVYLPIFELLLVGVLAYKYRASIISTFKDVAKHKSSYLKKFVIYMVILFATVKLFELLDVVLFPQYTEVLGDNEETVLLWLSSGGILAILSASLLGPVMEEYTFRYGVMSKMLIGVNRYVAAMIATVLFVFIHIGFTQMLTLGIAELIHISFLYIPSFVISFVYAREENLLFPILLHMANNIVATISSL